MEGGGSVALPLKKNGIESGLTQLQTKWGELEKGFQDWVCKQPLPVETAAIAATRALQGAAEGLFYGTLAKSEVARQLFPSEIFGRTTLLKARSIAILRGTNGAMVCALKRIRGGKGDTEAREVQVLGLGKNRAEPYRVHPYLYLNERNVSLAFAGFTSGFMFQTFTHSPLLIAAQMQSQLVSSLLFVKLLGMSHHATAGIPLGPRIKILNHIESFLIGLTNIQGS
ncbi:hypothetical protein MKX03_023537 [Papaver bracteatum]|nr:hypothetical protein MKX03_023537 [Papaver bracteatum]